MESDVERDVEVDWLRASDLPPDTLPEVELLFTIIDCA